MHGIVTIHKLNAQAAQANAILEEYGETARVLTSADFAKPAPECACRRPTPRPCAAARCSRTEPL